MAFSSQRRQVLLLHAALYLLCLAGLAAAGTVLPLADLPNHLARAYIIHTIDRSPAIAEAYRVQWQFTPYVLMEVTLDQLQNVMSVYAAGKVFIGLSLAAVALGVIAVNLAIDDTLAVTTLLAYPLFFGLVFAMGFLNFLLGSGIALLSYAWWLGHRSTAYRHAGLFLLFNLNFFAHPISYGILVLLVVLREAMDAGPHQDLRERARHCAIVLLLAAPQLAFWALIPREHMMVTEPFLFGPLIQKLPVLVTPFILSFEPTSFLAPTILIAALYASCRVFRLLTIDCVHLRMLVVLIAVSPLVPLRLLGIHHLDIRLPFVTALLLAAVLKPRALTHARRRVLEAAVIGIAVFRLTMVFKTMSGCAAQMEDLRAALAGTLKLPAAPLLAVQDDPLGACSGLPRSFDNASTLAVIESQSFAPLVFTLIPPVKAADRFRDIDLGVGEAVRPGPFFSESMRRRTPYLRDWENKFRYVLWLHFGRTGKPALDALTPLAQHPDFTIFEITRHPPAPP